MRRISGLSLALVLMVAAAACPGPTGPCVPGSYAIILTAVDSITRAAVPGATISATDSLGVSQGTIGPTSTYPVAIGSSPGVYNVTITSVGYNDWIHTITVDPSDVRACAANTVNITAVMLKK